MDNNDRNYHHGDLRHTLIEAACEHILASGADTLSLRALARQVGVSQTAPYRHFKSKSALFVAIAVYGFELLGAELRQAREQNKDDINQALIETGVTYIEWALKNPEKYGLFFDSGLIEFADHPNLVAAGQESFLALQATIQAGIDEGMFINRSIESLSGAAWASLHGLASLLLSKSDFLEPSNLEKVTLEQGLDENVAIKTLSVLASDIRGTVELFVRSLKK